MADDTNGVWDTNNAVMIAFNGNAAQVSGFGATFYNGNLTIKQVGTYVLILNDSFTLEAAGDGIQANNADDDTKGYVIINGGTYVIQSKNDGIQAQSAFVLICRFCK